MLFSLLGIKKLILMVQWDAVKLMIDGLSLLNIGVIYNIKWKQVLLDKILNIDDIWYYLVRVENFHNILFWVRKVVEGTQIWVQVCILHGVTT